jgi:peptide/nickel transport system substrate-binding protein
MREHQVFGRRAGAPRVVLAAIAAIALVASACGGGEEPAPGDTPTTEEPTDDGDAAPVDAGAFRIAMPTVVSNIDPAVYEGTPTTEVEAVWAAPLYEFVDPPGAGEDLLGLTGLDYVEPLLVESDEVEDDGSLVITLKEGVVSPYGNTLTSADVEWTFDRVIANDFVGRFVMSVGRIDPENPIEIIDDRTFRVRVSEPNPYVRGVLTLWDLSPLDSTEVLSHATEEDPWGMEWLNTNSATFGPYKVASFAPGEQVVLELNPNWFGETPQFSSVIMQQVPDASARLQLLSRGEVDYAVGLQPSQFESLQGEGDDVTTTTRLTPRIVPIELNFAYEPFQDVRVRQAIAHAIDRDAIVAGPMRGFARPLSNQILTALPQPAAPAGYTYDPDEARRLLAEAGYADGLEFPLTINLTRPGPYAEQIAVLIASQLADVGITVEVETIASSSEFEERKTGGQLTTWLGANTPIVPDAWYFMQLEHHSVAAFQNWKGFADTDFDAELGILRDLPLGPERDAQISKLHQYMMDVVPWVPVFEELNLVAVRQGIDINSFRQYTPYAPIVREIRLE